jgi:hypothetical protein
MRHINALCGRNVEIPNIKVGGIYSYHYGLRAEIFRTAFSNQNEEVETYFEVSFRR